jgi:myo-inositol-1(or 4)-monophosphatase
MELIGLPAISELLTVCEQAARAGGAVLLDWAERFSVREKGPADLVTDADLASQEAVRRVVLGAFPDHDFLSEEDVPGDKVAAAASSSLQPTAHSLRWICDPLDGTTNYVHRVPEFAVSLAVERGGELLAGCVFNPVTGECFTGSCGGGAFLNDRPIHASGVERLDQALVAVSFPPKVLPDSRVLREFGQVTTRAQAIRRTGSAALNLCYVAAGRFDAYFARETKTWDVAAGWLLIREAGGLVTDINGGPCHLDNPRFIAAGSEALRQEIQAILSPDAG